jgi:hypothetical protein
MRAIEAGFDGGGSNQRTLNSDPRTERMTMAKREMTTLWKTDTHQHTECKGISFGGKPYQDQAFITDTTGFMVLLVVAS